MTLNYLIIFEKQNNNRKTSLFGFHFENKCISNEVSSTYIFFFKI